MDDTLFIFIGFLAWAALFGGVGYVIGNAKGRGADGFALGVLIGFIGWLIIALLPEKGEKCPECFGVVPAGARRCKHCGIEFGDKRASETTKLPHGDAFYVLRGEKTEGPFSRRQLQILVGSDALARDTLCAREGDSNWVAVRSIM